MKRRGWPETANTWEPLENLHSIADVIDSFEGRLVHLNLNVSSYMWYTNLLFFVSIV